MLSDRTKHVLNGSLVLLLTVAVTASVTLFDMKGFLYRTSVLSYPEHAPFDGTVYPIAKSPDWAKLSSEKWKFGFDQLSASDLIDLPKYDPSQLATPASSLKWGNAADNVIRDAKITYSVPYLGNYKLDGIEDAGSHPAVDIKIPMNTPIVAIANGVVVKAQNDAGGFGYHIVLMHNNFPTLDDSSAKEVIYSGYAHLSEIEVEVGSVVKKGDEIGLSGQSGTSTTPHLHFQIDNSNAPWHPYWPFTWKEASDAGLDFFSAINAGLGKEAARRTTINPMKYVQEYLNYDGASDDTQDSASVEDPVVTENVPSDPVIESVDANVDVSVGSDSDASEVKADDLSATVDEVDDSEQLFTDIRVGNEYYGAVNYLVNAGVINGYSDGTFRPDRPVNRVESLKFILEATKSTLDNGSAPFRDTSDDQWYSKYLFTAYSKNIVNGNPDGTFRPTDTVNRAEFFKILFNGMSVDISPTVEFAPYDDVTTSDWFAPFLAYAKDLGLLDTNSVNIKPSGEMTRGDVAQSMYRLMKLRES